MTIIDFNQFKIGEGQKVFIIAEAGVNHILEEEDLEKINLHNSLEVAFRLVDEAKNAGADAIKFQSFSAQNLQFKGTSKPQYQNENVGKDINYYDLIKKYETSQEDQIKIAIYCKKKEIIFLSTPYDRESALFLNDQIKVPLFKLASLELNNHLFTKYVANFNKPILLSTGLSTLNDVKEALEYAKTQNYYHNLILLQCTSDYPVKADEINLNVLKTYHEMFPDLILGFSDHSESNTASIGAVILGAKVLEKHFTLNRNFKGPDHIASLDPIKLNLWIKQIREIESNLGSYEKTLTQSEQNNVNMRKFLVITPIKKGSLISEKDLKTMRTGIGILPTSKNLKQIIGKKIKIDIDHDLPLDWKMIEN